MENREATFSQLRCYAKLCFAKNYTSSALDEQEQEHQHYQAGVGALTDNFRPVRKYRRSLGQDEGPLSADARVNSCLLEYGESVAKALGGGE